jgi:hypothetical protein
MDCDHKTEERKVPWNKGKRIGQRPPLRLNEIWPIRIRLRPGGGDQIALPRCWLLHSGSPATISPKLSGPTSI